MKFSVEPKDFLAAIRFAKKAVPGRALIDVLTHVRITVADGLLSVEGSDLEVYARKRVTAAALDGGGCCVNARTIEQIAGSCRGLVTGSLVNGRLKIQSGLLEADLPTLPAADFPGVDLKIEGETEVDVDLKPFGIFTKEDFAKPYIGGVNVVGGKICASNGSAAMWVCGVNDVTANVHFKHLPLLFGRLFLSAQRWRCEGDGEASSGLLLQETISPSHIDKLFSDGGDYLLSVDADAWLAALSAVAIDEKTTAVLHTIKGGKMTLSSSGGVGAVSDEVTVEGDADFAVGFQIELARKVLTSAAGCVLEVFRDGEIYRMRSGETRWWIAPYRMEGTS